MNGSTQRTAKRSQFDEVFFEDFDGTQLDRSIWEIVYEADYHNGMFSRSEDQVSVGGGQLTIRTEREDSDWVSGGVSTIPDGITYGRYSFRALVEEGQGTAGVILLWPTSNNWTDEVDTVETHRPDRSASPSWTTATRTRRTASRSTSASGTPTRWSGSLGCCG